MGRLQCHLHLRVRLRKVLPLSHESYASDNDRNLGISNFNVHRREVWHSCARMIRVALQIATFAIQGQGASFRPNALDPSYACDRYDQLVRVQFFETSKMTGDPDIGFHFWEFWRIRSQHANQRVFGVANH